MLRTIIMCLDHLSLLVKEFFYQFQTFSNIVCKNQTLAEIDLLMSTENARISLNSRSLILLVGIFLYFPTKGVCGEPTQLVNKFHTVVISIMKSSSTTESIDRYKILEPVIKNTFHFPFMTRLTTGRHWKKASLEDKNALIEAFTRMSISTYVSRFNSYSGQIFRVVSKKNGPNNTRMVYTRLINPASKSIKLTYIFRQFDIGWRVIKNKKSCE